MEEILKDLPLVDTVRDKPFKFGENWNPLMYSGCTFNFTKNFLSLHPPF